jgi:hypothetical protein
LKQLPEGTETAQVFVGELESLKRARFVMVRLAQPTLMPEIIERQLPVRFIFLILGPHLRDGNYHELGRSMATLMSNKVGRHNFGYNRNFFFFCCLTFKMLFLRAFFGLVWTAHVCLVIFESSCSNLKFSALLGSLFCYLLLRKLTLAKTWYAGKFLSVLHFLKSF